jgi:hypothetical protein
MIKAKVNSIDTYYSDDPALSLPLAKDGEAVEFYVQGANLAANGQPLPGQVSEWLRYVGTFPQNTAAAASTTPATRATASRSSCTGSAMARSSPTT